MRIKPFNLTILFVLVCVSLSACSGTSPTAAEGAVETIAAATFQALTQQAASNPIAAVDTATPAATATDVPPAAASPTATNAPHASAPTAVPPAIPVQIVPRGSFIPYPADSCERLRASFEEVIGAPVTIESTPFSDRVSGGTGTACRVHATGNGATYGMAGPYNLLINLLPTLGWTEDSYNYGAGGPTGMGTGYTKGGALGLFHVGWQPSADANCPKDQPIGACILTPEQKLFDVTFDVADMVVYNPPTVEDCAGALAALQPAIPVSLTLETVDFTDFEMNRGTACQARAEGNGTQFSNMVDISRSIDAILTSFGWTLVNGADGPTGTGREYTLGNMVAISFVKWKPSADANCPKDQPISMCPLTPQQVLFTVTIAFGEK